MKIHRHRQSFKNRVIIQNKVRAKMQKEGIVVQFNAVYEFGKSIPVCSFFSNLKGKFQGIKEFPHAIANDPSVPIEISIPQFTVISIHKRHSFFVIKIFYDQCVYHASEIIKRSLSAKLGKKLCALLFGIKWHNSITSAEKLRVIIILYYKDIII